MRLRFTRSAVHCSGVQSGLASAIFSASVLAAPGAPVTRACGAGSLGEANLPYMNMSTRAAGEELLPKKGHWRQKRARASTSRINESTGGTGEVRAQPEPLRAASRRDAPWYQREHLEGVLINTLGYGAALDNKFDVVVARSSLP